MLLMVFNVKWVLAISEEVFVGLDCRECYYVLKVEFFGINSIEHSKFYQILPILPYNRHINRDILTFMDRLSLIAKICNFTSLWLVVWLHIFFIYILPQYPPPPY